MFHMELFTGSIATGAQAFAQVPYYTTDNILPAQVSGVQVSPDLPFVHSVFGVGAHQVHLRLQANSMLPFPYMTLGPNNRGTAFESPPRIYDFSRVPPPLKATEEFDVFATQNAGAGETQYVAVNFSDSKFDKLPMAINPASVLNGSPAPGRAAPVHWTTSATLTAGTWSKVQPLFDQALPAGYYALCGARIISSTGLFFRMFPAMGPKWRPGGIAAQAYDQMDPIQQRLFYEQMVSDKYWGVWLYFYQNVPPQVEIFATGADTNPEGWFDLVYLGPQFVKGAI
jgi:hypothetical protein